MWDACRARCSVAFASVIVILSLASWLAACQVPVFRYAIERWLGDKYEVVVMRGAIWSSEDEANFEELQKGLAVSANLQVRAIDMRDSKEPSFRSLWERHLKQKDGHGEKPMAAILYPASATESPSRLMDVVPFDRESMTRLIRSPAREEIAKRLLDGQSAVWVFIPSGKKLLDEPAKQALDLQLAKSQSELVLPSLEEMEIDESELQEKKIRLRIEFSSLTVDRSDPKEDYFLQMLLKSEADLMEADEPIAFPIFGRGRVLYALVGKGINSEMIHQACGFVTGPCSCQVKQQNPGFDLLTNIPWEEKIGDSKISDPLPDSEKDPVLLKIPSGRGNSKSQRLP